MQINEIISEGEVKQSFALKVLSNIASRRDNSPFPVKFYDGSTLKVNPYTARKFLNFYDESDPEKQHWILNYLKTKKGFLELMQPEFVENIEENINEVIRKVGDKYRLYSKKGKNLGTYDSRAGAEKREKQVNYFKHMHEETGVEMLKLFRNMHHDTAKNKEMDAFIKSHSWELRDFTPDMFPSEEEFFDYDDPFDRVIDIDYNHRVDLSSPIIVGPQYKDGKYSVIDGNHRAARAQALGKTIKGYFPVKATTEGVAQEPDPTGYSKTALTAPANTIVINTPGELDWYKMGEYIANLNNEDPHEFGQSESDMVVTVANREQMIRLKKMLDRFGAEYKEIGGSHEHPEVHTETKQ